MTGWPSSTSQRRKSSGRPGRETAYDRDASGWQGGVRLSQEPGNFALVVVDIPGHSVLRRVALEKTPRDVEFGFDGKALYFTLAGVNAVQVLDPASDKIVAQVPTGASPHIANFYRGASAGTAVVQGPGELLLFNPETNAPLRSIAVGKQPHWEATADGKTIYVTNEGGNDVSIVDLATGKVTSVPVGKAPRKVVVQRVAAAAPAGGTKVSIANFAFAPATLAIAPARRSRGATTTARRTGSPIRTARRGSMCCSPARVSAAPTTNPARSTIFAPCIPT